ncbi:hypothetical protein [Chitinivibrio alkaliphilus]|uniref:DUF2490 domain-containing protein n=1 Tax=Chitinivibrio alkaliphilus ACht1 TaxID=1313304 RepID=U7DC08_9BACT|nr:hypothetical protein [Chitinivibrio alkaliphilus]ERP31945.1 hypothetical protein CALK_1164 [Chitinivibrio alkaliphilus ACht1]
MVYGGVVLFIFVFIAHARDVDITRNHIWPRLTVRQEYEHGFGALISTGFRHNRLRVLDRQGEPQDTLDTQEMWLREVWGGPTWRTPLGERSRYGTSFLYRPQFQYVADAPQSPLVRHTLQSSHSLVTSLTSLVAIHQRIILWGLWDNSNHGKEVVLRYLLGPEFHVSPFFSLHVKGESFFRIYHTDDALDDAGILHRVILWSGVTLRPFDSVSLSVEYVRSITLPDDIRRIQDNYFHIHTTFTL